MTKRKTKHKRPARRREGPNWYLIGGIIGVGLLALIGLLALSVQAPAPVDAFAGSVEAYCAQNVDACVSLGNPEAPARLIEISDMACPHCRDYHEETEPQIQARYVATGQLHYTALPYALRDETIPAAMASLCAAEQEGYFGFVAALFADFDRPDHLTRAGFSRAATNAGLELEAFEGCVSAGGYREVVERNIAVAVRNQITSTPNFILNGQRLEGALPFAVFQQQIERLLPAS